MLERPVVGLVVPSPALVILFLLAACDMGALPSHGASSRTAGWCGGSQGAWVTLPREGLVEPSFGLAAWARDTLIVFGDDRAAAIDLVANRWESVPTEGRQITMQPPFGVWDHQHRLVDDDWVVFPTQTGVDQAVQAYSIRDRRWLAPVVTTGVETEGAIAWTGHELLRWSERGVRIDLRTGEQRPISSSGAPSHRHAVASGWTGTHLFVWGGVDDPSPYPFLSSGALYDPRTDTWLPVANAGAPSPRANAHVHWTGSKVVVFGGAHLRPPSPACGLSSIKEWFDGGAYDPRTDRWEPIPSFAPESTDLVPEWIAFADERVITMTTTWRFDGQGTRKVTLHVYDLGAGHWRSVGLPDGWDDDDRVRPIRESEQLGSVKSDPVWFRAPTPARAGAIGRLDLKRLAWDIAILPATDAPVATDQSIAWNDGCLVMWRASPSGTDAAMIAPVFQ